MFRRLLVVLIAATAFAAAGEASAYYKTKAYVGAYRGGFSGYSGYGYRYGYSPYQSYGAYKPYGGLKRGLYGYKY